MTDQRTKWTTDVKSFTMEVEANIRMDGNTHRQSEYKK